MKRSVFLLSCALTVAAAGSASAQTASLESRLRDQLRDTRSQLQDLQAQQAQWAAQKASLEAERDAALADAGAAKSARASAPVRPAVDERALVAERKKQEELQSGMDRLRNERDVALQEAHAAQAERARLDGELKNSESLLGTCSAKNDLLYGVGKDILNAYENLSVSDVIAARQPFAAKARVRLDNAAQAFSDRLYEQRVDTKTARNP